MRKHMQINYITQSIIHSHNLLTNMFKIKYHLVRIVEQERHTKLVLNSLTLIGKQLMIEKKVEVVSLFLVFLFMLVSFTASSKPVVFLHNDTLTISNDLIKRQFLWNNGELISFSFFDYESCTNLISSSNVPSFNFYREVELRDSHFEKREIVQNKQQNGGLEAEIVLDYGSFKLKRIFRISENVPVISCSNYLYVKNQGDVKKIATLFQSAIELENLKTEFKYPRVEAIEFFDQTDRNNNLVKKEKSVAFTGEIKLKGNLLRAISGESEIPGIFILKKAPCSFVQLGYPGYDFKVVKNNITVEGTGYFNGNLITGEWVKLYGTVLGCFNGTDFGFMKTLRNYQNLIFKAIPDRDNMIMMNTWGDRNKDASINEPFLKAELNVCEKLGVTHFQIDDGWQQGLSQNSATFEGDKWDLWEKEDWEPNRERLPSGLDPIVKYAEQKGIQLGLWFHPSNYNSYENWQSDAEVILGLYNNYGIRYFKIDGIELPDKLAEHRLRQLFDKIIKESAGNIVINLDVTSGKRTGYFYLNTYGNIFLENRYTDWGNYYPHWTLRNLWQLSAYIPTKKLQIEFLNKWRNMEVYGENDPLSPYNIPFEYQFAITMMAQPLAWFEGTGLPKEAMEIETVIRDYKNIQEDIHYGDVFPIGDEPSGYGWTGFQSIKDEKNGYLMVFREKAETFSRNLKVFLPSGKSIRLTPILGKGKEINTVINEEQEIKFSLPNIYSYCLYKYVIEDIKYDCFNE